METTEGRRDLVDDLPEIRSGPSCGVPAPGDRGLVRVWHSMCPGTKVAVVVIVAMLLVRLVEALT